MTEPVRLALDLIHAALAPLSKEDRAEVLGQLDLACAKMVTEANAQVDGLRDQVAELRAHNAQRHEDVWKARELLGAQPDETLPMAIQRILNVPMSNGPHTIDEGRKMGCVVCLRVATRTVGMHTSPPVIDLGAAGAPTPKEEPADTRQTPEAEPPACDGGSRACTHEGIGLPGCVICDPRVLRQ